MWKWHQASHLILGQKSRRCFCLFVCAVLDSEPLFYLCGFWKQQERKSQLTSQKKRACTCTQKEETCKHKTSLVYPDPVLLLISVNSFSLQYQTTQSVLIKPQWWRGRLFTALIVFIFDMPTRQLKFRLSLALHPGKYLSIVAAHMRNEWKWEEE